MNLDYKFILFNIHTKTEQLIVYKQISIVCMSQSSIENIHLYDNTCITSVCQSIFLSHVGIEAEPTRFTNSPWDILSSIFFFY